MTDDPAAVKIGLSDAELAVQQTVYAHDALKDGVIGRSQAVAVEWAPVDIRVNCVAPGVIETEGWNVYSPEARAAYPRSNPMTHVGTTFDVGKPACFGGDK